MGLDMFLSRKVNYGGAGKEIKEVQVVPKQGEKKVVEITNEHGRVSIETEVAYWRKANAIHKWFVDNCSGGKDDCYPTDVYIEQLRDLKVLCEKVKQVAKVKRQIREDGSEFRTITNADEVAELLPTQSGFFFGSTEYDEWYLQDIEYTIEQLDKIISEHEKLVANGKAEYGVDYVYEASW